MGVAGVKWAKNSPWFLKVIRNQGVLGVLATIDWAKRKKPPRLGWLFFWCARRDLKASHGLQPAIHRLTKPSAFFLQTDHPPTCYPQTAIANIAISSLHPPSGYIGILAHLKQVGFHVVFDFLNLGMLRESPRVSSLVLPLIQSVLSRLNHSLQSKKSLMTIAPSGS